MISNTDRTITKHDSADCVAGAVSGSGSEWAVASKDWDAAIPAGGSLEVNFIAYHGHGAVQPGVIHLELNGGKEALSV